ncbi:MAG: HAD family phosphatase [Candidatus Omnitrophica bacterium]|nr:HAD family phosphatase [Candidatus Omnitrophota bacterium]
MNTLFIDLGGVLVSLQIEKALKAYLSFSGVSEEAVQSLLQKRDPQDLCNRYEKGLIEKTGFYRSVAGFLGLEITPEEFERIWNSMIGPAVPGMEAALRGLKAAGRAEIHLLSNTNPGHYGYVCENEPWIPELCDGVHLSYEMGLLKPDPAFYEAVLRQSGGVSRTEVLFVDDTAANLETARALGLQTHLFISSDAMMAQVQVLC